MRWLSVRVCVVTMVTLPLQPSQKLSAQQEAERQAIQSLRGGGALTGKFLSTSSLPAGELDRCDITGFRELLGTYSF